MSIENSWDAFFWIMSMFSMSLDFSVGFLVSFEILYVKWPRVIKWFELQTALLSVVYGLGRGQFALFRFSNSDAKLNKIRANEYLNISHLN